MQIFRGIERLESYLESARHAPPRADTDAESNQHEHIDLL
jgi:hypothetical protein